MSDYGFPLVSKQSCTCSVCHIERQGVDEGQAQTGVMCGLYDETCDYEFCRDIDCFPGRNSTDENTNLTCFIQPFLLLVVLSLLLIFPLLCLLLIHHPGIRSWDTNLIDCNLDQELKLFVSRHSARFSADVRGKLGIKDMSVDHFRLIMPQRPLYKHNSKSNTSTMQKILLKVLHSKSYGSKSTKLGY